MYQRSDKFERTFFPRIVPKNEQTNSLLVLLGQKTEFVCSFLEESEDTKSRNYLTFSPNLRLFFSEKEPIEGLYYLDFTYKALKPEKPDFSSMTQEFKSNCHRHFRSLKVLKLVTKNTLSSKIFHSQNTARNAVFF